jgi:eukaryotic-like serine/threonine-protein kinase
MPDTNQPSATVAAAGVTGGGEELTGQTIGDYAIVRKLGQGGMGQVYLADQLSLKRRVALKFLRREHLADPVALKRFKAEAEAVARVTHANIVQVYAIGEHVGLNFMVLEYVEGRTLRQYIAKKGTLDLPVALSIMKQVAAALQRASESGIVHRDIKPENILLTRKGEVKVADFGLSRRVETGQDLHLTQSGQTLGTPLYMSPEQLQGKPIDARSDVYSFGITCYHMLAGRPPFEAATAIDLAMQHVHQKPPPLQGYRPDLPPELPALIHRMMSKEPADRPQTGREIIRALAGLHGHSQQSDNPFAGLTAAAAAARTEPLLAAPTPPPAASATQPVPITQRPRATLLLHSLSVLLAVACGVVLRLALGGSPVPAPAIADDAPAPAGPVISERERFLLLAVEQSPAPKQQDKIKEGAGHHVELAVLYLDQKRYDKAQELFAGMKAAGTPWQYKMIGDLGLAILAAMRDEVDQSNTLFSNAAKRKPAPAQVFLPANLPVEASINLRYWVLTALDRNATRKPLTQALVDLQSAATLKPPPPRPNAGGKGKLS